MEQQWMDFVGALDASEDVRREFSKGYGVEAVANKDGKRLQIKVRFDALFPLHWLVEMERAFSLHFPGYQVRIQPVYPNLQSHEMKGFGAYLDHCLNLDHTVFPLGTVIYGDSGLEVGLGNPFHREAFHEKKAKAYLERICLESLGHTVPIRITTNEGPEERQNNIRNREKEALDKALMASEAQAKANGPKRSTDSLVLYGKTIMESGEPAGVHQDPLKGATVYGRIGDLESRLLKGENTLISFRLTSKTKGVPCKMFLRKGEDLATLHNGLSVKVHGDIAKDPYKDELVLSVRDVARYSEAPMVDTAEIKRVELHLHTKMSSLDATVDVKALFKRMKELGHDTVALTDHGVVQIYPEAYKHAKEAGIKVLYGLEGYLYDDSTDKNHKGKANHVIILVQNQVGLKNLYTLVSESHLNYYYRTPRIPKTLLTAHREGLIIGTACNAGELFRGIIGKASDAELMEIAAYYDYLEIQPITNNEYMYREGSVGSIGELQDFNKKVVEIARQSGKPVVATGDVHFLDKEDAIFRAILMKSKGYADVTQPSLHYRSTQEMLDEFTYLDTNTAYEAVVSNPRAIADRIEEILPIPEKLFTPEIEGAEDTVTQITMDEAHRLYGEVLPEIVARRLERELNSIVSHGFAVLYLIAHKLVKKSNEDGYVVGSRGSVGSSLVATMMGITEVNPLAPHYRCPDCHTSEFPEGDTYGCGIDLPGKECPVCGSSMVKDGFNIPFETFLGFKGDKIPDIDLNFSGEYQGTIHRYTEELFGKGNVFKAGTISTVAERTAIGFVKKYHELENLPMPKETDLVALAAGCVGVKRTTGQHPGGLVVVPKQVDIHEFTPVQRPADDVDSDITTTHFDYHSINDCLVKLDLLGHDDPTLIKHLEEMTGISASTIPLDDPDIMSLFNSPDLLGLSEKFVETGSIGLPEFGTNFVRTMLLITKPKVFSDLIRISGLSHGTDVWLNNAKDLIVSGKVQLSEVISTRDDIMYYLQCKGLEDGLAFKIMEDVRKGKRLKEDYAEEMSKHDVPRWYIDSCNKISYMFPKAHATAYVIMAVRLGWYKIHHKEAFYASYFSVRGNLFDYNRFRNKVVIREELAKLNRNDLNANEKDLRTLLEVAYEMHLRGLEFTSVSMMDSDSKGFKVDGDGRLVPPFSAIPKLGNKAAMSLVTEREKRPFLSVEEVGRRCRINTSLLDEMRKLGLFEGLPESEQLSLF